MYSFLANNRIAESLLLVVTLSAFSILLVHFFAEHAPILLLVFAIALLLVLFGSRIEGFFILLYISLSATFLENDAGIQPIELPFYFLSVAFGFYTLLEILRGNIPLDTFFDKMILLTLLLIAYALVIGILNGASPYQAFGEITYLFGFLVYFPVRKHLKNPLFQKVLITVLILIVVFVLIRNLINYRQILLQAVMAWETEKARVTANEFVLMFGALFFMAYASITPSLRKQLACTVAFFLVLGGLILTQSRGYWLAFFLGTLTLLFVIDWKGKFRITITFFLTVVPAIILLQLFFTDQLSLIVNGLANRVNSIFSGKMDWSLYERVLESKNVLEKMYSNPIAGYGLGATYTKKYLFYDTFVETSYVHNGYLATWLKFGLPGVIVIYSMWVGLITKGVKLYRTGENVINKVIPITIVSTVTGALLVNNTSPQILNFESVLFLTIFAAYISHVQMSKNE